MALQQPPRHLRLEQVRDLARLLGVRGDLVAGLPLASLFAACVERTRELARAAEQTANDPHVCCAEGGWSRPTQAALAQLRAFGRR